jgi:outer membrane lipoprotein
MFKRLLLSIPLLTLLLAGCASGPDFPDEGIAKKLTPQKAVAEIDNMQGKRVIWGGTILASRNLEEKSQLEILAYPLDDNHYPDRDEGALGRFLAESKGYLETVDYAVGRQVSILGSVREVRSGQVDAADYQYPLIEVEQIYLWPKGGKPESRVHFGIGVMFSN